MTTLEKIRAEIANLTCDCINGMVNQYAVLQIIDKYAEPTTLEQIRAEIEQIKPYDLPCDKRTPQNILDMALEIVDKYAEQEPTSPCDLCGFNTGEVCEYLSKCPAIEKAVSKCHTV